VKFAIFDRKMFKVNASCPIDDRTSIRLFGDIGFLPGREYSEGKVRYRRYACDRYDLVRTMAEWAMGEHLDLNEWTFGWDSAKRRLGVCKYDQKLISLSRYFVDFHSEDEIDQVMRHEIAHALAGPKAGHGPKWKKIASEIGYKHEKISGDEIGNATAKLIGTCPNGHVVYRHRKPKTMLSCSKCATRFDKRFLITWSSR
jgi:predicted SprT family Zn-dependent metalloprotease